MCLWVLSICLALTVLVASLVLSMWHLLLVLWKVSLTGGVAMGWRISWSAVWWMLYKSKDGHYNQEGWTTVEWKEERLTRTHLCKA